MCPALPTRVILALLLASFAFGLSFIASLPPWEGFDEPAHYSSVQELADERRLPRLKRSKTGKDIEDYARSSPTAWLDPEAGTAQYMGLSYTAYASSSGAKIVHHPPLESRQFRPGWRANWQAQHPPLYYLMLAPVYQLTRDWSWASHVFVLRIISYLFAWGAIALAVFSCRRRLHPLLLLGILLWPLVCGSWLPAMARIGNDTLCALLIAVLWALLLRVLQRGPHIGLIGAIGLTLGLGSLTKAFFVPVSVGTALWLFVHTLRAGPDRRVRRALTSPAIAGLICFAIAGWWYVLNLLEFGVFMGSDEMVQLHDAGGLAKRLPERFSIMEWARGHAAIVATLAWCSSWSWARVPTGVLGIPSLTVLLGVLAYGFALRKSEDRASMLLPLWLIVPVLIGLSVHVLVRIGLTGEGRGTSGYYLNVLAVPLGIMLGGALKTALTSSGTRTIACLLAIYGALLAMFTLWAQALLYAGRVIPAPGTRLYTLRGPLPSDLGFAMILDGLGHLAYPHLALGAYAAGLVACVMAVVWLWRAAKASDLTGREHA